jgi:hypothetical protein
MVRLTNLAGVATLALSEIVAASYSLLKTYNASNFFNEFQIMNIPDPSSGFVQYVDAATAKSKSLVGIRNGQVYLGADSITNNTTNGRPSVRVESTDYFTTGLFIADIAHMPGNACGVWPAYWTSGPNWPNSGEIDIIEATNLQKTPIITLHSGTGCTVANTGRRRDRSLLVRIAIAIVGARSRRRMRRRMGMVSMLLRAVRMRRSGRRRGLRSGSFPALVSRWTSRRGHRIQRLGESR